MAYSTERRAAVLKKLEPPNAVPLRQLAKDEGISEATLHTWRRDARSQGRLLPDADAGPEACLQNSSGRPRAPKAPPWFTQLLRGHALSVPAWKPAVGCGSRGMGLRVGGLGRGMRPGVQLISRAIRPRARRSTDW